MFIEISAVKFLIISHIILGIENSFPHQGTRKNLLKVSMKKPNLLHVWFRVEEMF